MHCCDKLSWPQMLISPSHLRFLQKLEIGLNPAFAKCASVQKSAPRRIAAGYVLKHANLDWKRCWHKLAITRGLSGAGPMTLDMQTERESGVHWRPFVSRK